MKRILIGISAMLLVLALGGVGTYAWLHDTETADGNTFQAGTLTLGVGDTVTVQGATVGNLKPTDTFTVSFKVSNSGNLPGTLKATIKDLVDGENVITEMEAEDSDITADHGELSANMKLTGITFGGATVNSASVNQMLHSIEGTVLDLGTLPALTTDKVLVLSFEIPQGTNSVIMTDTTSFDVLFNLKQLPATEVPAAVSP